MFDVPPPDDGIRGLENYAQTWLPFFEWQASGALFEIVSLEVTAGSASPSPAPSCAVTHRRRWPRTRTTGCD